MRKNKLGQSMFELLVAIFVVAITLVALVGLVTGSIGNTTFSKERTQANKYTQEAVEWLRSQRDSDWGQFVARASASGTIYCIHTLNWNPPCSTGQIIAGTNFRREATLIYNPLTSETLEARVVTTWSDSSGTHESRVTTYFSDWRTR